MANFVRIGTIGIISLILLASTQDEVDNTKEEMRKIVTVLSNPHVSRETAEMVDGLIERVRREQEENNKELKK